jgi:hypothetical protein
MANAQSLGGSVKQSWVGAAAVGLADGDAFDEIDAECVLLVQALTKMATRVSAMPSVRICNVNDRDAMQIRDMEPP